MKKRVVHITKGNERRRKKIKVIAQIGPSTLLISSDRNFWWTFFSLQKWIGTPVLFFVIFFFLTIQWGRRIITKTKSYHYVWDQWLKCNNKEWKNKNKTVDENECISPLLYLVIYFDKIMNFFFTLLCLIFHSDLPYF